ncbi:hypothetical protein V8G54_022083 [Vigna mungo]|uniref:Uncharacterized protein n=1 Tax=Vigna mungo TaxID=3915 RepID=A0AAQ3NH90_VIGMU
MAFSSSCKISMAMCRFPNVKNVPSHNVRQRLKSRLLKSLKPLAFAHLRYRNLPNCPGKVIPITHFPPPPWARLLKLSSSLPTAIAHIQHFISLENPTIHIPQITIIQHPKSHQESDPEQRQSLLRRIAIEKNESQITQNLS